MNSFFRWGTAPTTIKIAIGLVITSVVFRISLVVSALLRGGHISSLYWTGLVLFGGLTVVQLLFAVAFMRGMNWTRWLYLALIALSLLTLPSALRDAFTRSIFSGVYASSQDLLQISAVVLLFLKSSSYWFRKPISTAPEPAAT